LIAETRPAVPLQPGQGARGDYEYQRNGTANLLVFCEPQLGWRHLAVTERRTMQDFAHQMPWLVDERSPDAEVIRVVLDQLTTHKPASLYDAFAPEEARRIRRKLEFHYTPKPGSWLNRAEIELSVLQRQCLDRRLPDVAALTQELHAYEQRRNAQRATIDWHFTTQQARIKLHRLYPSIPT
jgi:DDE superfamily endonuclease